MTKTGFYSGQFRQSEAKDLQSLDEPGLQDEIAVLRVAIRRTMEVAEGVDDLKEMMQVLRALAQAVGRLSELLHTQAKISITDHASHMAGVTVLLSFTEG